MKLIQLCYCLLLGVYCQSAAAQTITTYAGHGIVGYSGDGGPATNADLGVYLVALDASGNLYMASSTMVRKVTPAGIISTVAGADSVGYTGDGGPATDADLGVYLVALDASGNLYMASSTIVRKVNPAGMISTVAGADSIGYTGDGGPATDALLVCTGLAVDGPGNVYIADARTHCVRKIDTAGTITLFAGRPGHSGYGGENVPATDAILNYPTKLAIGPNGDLYIVDGSNYMVRRVHNGRIYAFAGNGSYDRNGDGGPALDASIGGVYTIATDLIGNVYISDGPSVRKIDTAGIINTVIGGGHTHFSGDGGPATDASFFGIAGIFVDKWGNVFVSDQYNNVVRRTGTDGIVTTYAGNYTLGGGYSGDGGPAIFAQLFMPEGLVMDPNGVLYIADDNNYCVRKVTATNGVPITGNAPGIALYPNPSTGSFGITVPQAAGEATLVISTLTGRVVARATAAAGSTATFDLARQPGTYVAEVITATTTWRQKVVVW